MLRSVPSWPSALRLATAALALAALPGCSLLGAGVDPQVAARDQARADSLARVQTVADSLDRVARNAALLRVIDRARAAAAARRAEVAADVARRDSLARRAHRREFVTDSLARAAFLADSLAAVAAAERAAEARRGRVIGTGGASYYANRFAGRRTASGERYRPGALTAAHRTLRFGTRVRVTNLRNGRSVVVRINDRGPFHRRRVIDLSRAAAQRIGMIRSGTARVRLEVL